MEREPNTAPVYSMGVAERLTGLTGRQIRYWEQQGLIRPARTRGRQRLYSEADIVRLKEIKRLLAEGMTLQRAKQYLAAKEARRRAYDPPETPHRLGANARLTSLYPPNNRAELLRLIDRDRD